MSRRMLWPRRKRMEVGCAALCHRRARCRRRSSRCRSRSRGPPPQVPMVEPVGGGLRFHRSHAMLGSSRCVERAKLTRSRASIRVPPGKGASWSLKVLAPEIPVPHSMRGLNLQNQCAERDMDFPAREHFRSDGGFCWVRALAKVIAEKGGQRLKLCNRSVEQLPRRSDHRRLHTKDMFLGCPWIVSGDSSD